MSTEVTAIDSPLNWEPSPPTDLIFDDEEPLETNRHRIAMTVLINTALMTLADQPNSFVGGNMFVYYSRNQAMNRDFRGSDFFVALDVDGTRERQGWVVWEEEGRYPDVIVELMSPSTAKIDRTVKKDLYERTFHTLDYYIYNPFDPTSLAGWHLNAQRRYDALEPNEQGWLWCETLGLWLGNWEGRVQREPAVGTCPWLRFYDAAGSLVLLPEEAAVERAEQAHQRAEQAEQEKATLLERLKARGIDPNDLIG